MTTERLAQLNRESQEIIDALYALAVNKCNVLAASIYLDCNLSASCSDCTEAEAAENLERFLREHLPGHFDGKATQSMADALIEASYDRPR